MSPGRVALVASIVVGALGACSSKAPRSDASADAVAETPPDLSPDTPPDVGPPETPSDVGPPETPPDVPRESRPDAEVEAPPDLGGESSDDGGRCFRPLEDVAVLCPASYSAIDSFACGRCSGTCSSYAGSCGDFLMFAQLFTFEKSICYYDASSGELVAMVHGTDTNAYCGGNAFYYWAGISVGACERPFFNPGLPAYVCADGGQSDGAAPDLSSPDSSGGG